MTKNRFNLLIVFILFVGVAGAVYYFISLPRGHVDVSKSSVSLEGFGWKFPIVKFPQTGSGNIAYSDIRDPGGIPEGLPVRLKIPTIGVDSAIEDALITPEGRMDIPAGSRNVAWFALGPHPGKIGSAVIGGHFGIDSGVKRVFYDLDKLKVGDKVYIVDDGGDTLAFVVRFIKLFDRNADASSVFTSQDNLAHLNLITCEGIWNQVNGNYPDRRVVFTDVVPAEGSIVIKAPVAATFFRSLNIGSHGIDVAALQTFLEEKSFLLMPQGIAKGYFGVLTGSAVMKYQASVGLPQAGVFGPLTKARLTEDLKVNPVLPETGAKVVENLDNTKVSPRIIIPSFAGLYATPMDGFITLLLLAGIVFVIVKIIRRR